MTIYLLIAGGYLLGSIPFGVLLTRAFGAGDLRQIGSGNIGATNVLRTGRKGLAAATLHAKGDKTAGGDAAKGDGTASGDAAKMTGLPATTLRRVTGLPAGSDAANSFASGINQVLGVGGGGLMTIGQMSEILVLACMPLLAKSLGRKSLLCIGLVAYAARMALFAYMPSLRRSSTRLQAAVRWGRVASLSPSSFAGSRALAVSSPSNRAGQARGTLAALTLGKRLAAKKRAAEEDGVV